MSCDVCPLVLQDPSGKKKQQGVYIGTVHSAKGLEWDAVWVLRTHYTSWKGIHGDELPWTYRPRSDAPPLPIAPHPYLPEVLDELTVLPPALHVLKPCAQMLHNMSPFRLASAWSC